MTQTAKKPVLPAILGILFLIPPFMYMLSHLILKRITLYSYDAFFYSNFRRIWNYLIVPNIWKDLLSCTWFGFAFLVLAVSFFIIKKTKIPACVGLGLLAVTMFVNSISALVSAINYFSYMHKYGTVYQYFYLLYDIAQVGMYFAIGVAFVLFMIAIITTFKIKPLGVIGCIILLVPSLFTSLFSYGLLITDFIQQFHHFAFRMLIPFFNSMVYDAFLLSIIIPCFIAFVFKAKSLKNLLQ